MYVEQRDAGGYRAWLTDVEPFDAAQTDALLFTWDELLAWPRSGQPAPPPDLRVIGVELPIRPSQRARPPPLRTLLTQESCVLTPPRTDVRRCAARHGRREQRERAVAALTAIGGGGV